MLFRLVVLSALLAACLAAPVVDSDEIAILSQSQPCRGRIAGTRLRHPTDDHKFLRCVGPESFWIETCPDNLFYNHELDLCDWTVISETTTAVNDIVKFRPVLFQNNKTVQNVERVEVVPRPAELVDNSKLPVRVISSRIRDDTDVAEIRQVPVVVESEEERESEPETVQRRVQTTTVRPVEIVRPVVVESEEPVQVTKVAPVVKTPVVVEEEEEVVKPVRVTSVPVVVAKPTPSSVVLEEVDEIKPVRVTPVPVVISKPVPAVELNVVKTVQVTPRPVVETETEVETVKPAVPVTQVEEVDVIKPVHVATTVQKPVVVVETEPDFAPKPVKFIARPGVGTRAFGALSSLIGSHPSASIIRTDFIHKLMPVVRS